MGVLSKARLAARKVGLEILRRDFRSSYELRLVAILEKFNIKFVLDVGANDGGFASSILDENYRGRILSVEPLPDAWQRLKFRAEARGGAWQIAERQALTDTIGAIEIGESENSVSSSILPVLESHVKAEPKTKQYKTHLVATSTVDQILKEQNINEPIYLKIDVQGAEMSVLHGSRYSLDKLASVVQLELSLLPLYEGQKVHTDIIDYMDDCGFILFDILPGFRDPNSFRLQQYDGIFVKRDLLVDVDR